MFGSTSHRRDFLKHTSGIAAGVAVPYWFTSRQVRAQEANDKLSVASIGVGGRGSGIGHQAGGRGNMIACADVDRTHAERFAGRYEGRCKIYADYRQLLDKEKPDIVTIGTPDHWHTKIAIDAMQAGCDVYCEKPLTLTIAEGQQICQVVEDTGRVFQVGTQQRSEMAQRFLKAVVMARSGRLGDTLTASCSIGGAPSGGPFPTSDPPEHLDWNTWLGQAPVVPYTRERCHGNFRWWLEYSGGKLTDWGAHHVDIAQWALGYENSGPIELEGEGEFPNIPDDLDPVAFFAGQQTIPNGYNTATKFKINVKFAKGDTIIVRHDLDNGVLLEGEKGRIFASRGRLTGKPIEEMTDQDKEWLDEEVAKLFQDLPPTGHMENFFLSVKERKQPISDVFTHHRSLSTCHMCNIAMLLKRKLRWDPEQEKFLDDDVANALLSRPQRKPFEIIA
jgi:predicted dehydrogenase